MLPIRYAIGSCLLVAYVAISVHLHPTRRDGPYTKNLDSFRSSHNASNPFVTAALAIDDQRIAMLTNSSKQCWMTNVVGNDGWGSQWQGIISSIVVAAKFGFNFAYSSMNQLEHMNNITDSQSIRSMETFAGLKSLRPIEDLPEDMPRQSISHPREASCNSPVVYTVNSTKSVLDGNPDWFIQFRPLLRQIFFSTPKIDLSKVFVGNRTNVVIHQRRFNRFDSRCTFLPNEYYIEIMTIIRNKHPDAVFHVLSQAGASQPFSDRPISELNCQDISNEQFEDFHKFGNTCLYLDLPLSQTIQMMIMSDILITSQSSFSYAAAVHSVGQVYSAKFWHSDLRGWKSCQWVWNGYQNNSVCESNNQSTIFFMLMMMGALAVVLLAFRIVKKFKEVKQIGAELLMDDV
jgi:hypothetical protein